MTMNDVAETSCWSHMPEYEIPQETMQLEPINRAVHRA